MKATIKYITMALLLWSCNQTPPKSITVAVLADKTDSVIPKPNIPHIKYFMDSPVYEKGKRAFWYGTITNTSVNAQYKAELSGSTLLENSLKRKTDVERFYKEIASHLEHENNTSKTYNNSSIITPLVAELNRIKQSNSADKVVLLYSDILEASDLLNVYETKGYLELRSHPDRVVERLEQQLFIGDLTGVELYIIYYPKELKDNRLFEQMLSIYRKLFEGSGLVIRVGIDNPLSTEP
ncbi:MAG: hypothetical protein ACK5M1_04665 [Xanthomarina gelatinilytica]|uniref:hypothetical protein n=1 Tax=Xanthomarina gelatinilytica TaxID=1137281 RepID=UPI003A83E504